MTTTQQPTKQVRCKSGLIGSQEKLQNRYDDFAEFESYCDIYGIHTRLGFSSPKLAWSTNPTIQSSINPSDLRVVKTNK